MECGVRTQRFGRHLFLPSLCDTANGPFIVAIDAVCRPGGDVSSGPLATTGDLCEEGGFYTDHPEGSYLGETMLSELEAEITSKYRARPPADL